MRTQVGIIGAGPAGLMLAHLLHQAGVESVVVESRSRRYVEERIRAGVIEQGSRDLLIEAGVGERMRREGLLHEGLNLKFAGRAHRIDLAELTGGKTVTVYGQHEVVKDLIARRLDDGEPILFEAEAIGLDGLDTDRPTIRLSTGTVIQCDLVAGCDGYHGIARDAVPAGVLEVFERTYPFAWLGILATTPPPSEELVYAHSDGGFALASMRTPEISRMYLQVDPDEDLALWPDERIWTELGRRLDVPGRWTVQPGAMLQKGVTAMRSFVVEPMQWGRLFLAGDAAHIVPPTGAKGMNLALADVRLLARAMADFARTGRRDGLDGYSAACLRRIWKVQRFSWWMTAMLHRFGDDNAFDRRRQVAELDYVTASRAAATTLAENYVGLPFD